MLCVSSPHPRSGRRPLGGWGKGTDNISDYDLALFFPLNVNFFKNKSKEFIIVFKTNVMETKRLQWNFDLRKGQGIDKILGLPNDGFLLNSLKTLFDVRTQSTFRFLEMHSKRRYKICICSVILGEL